MFSSRIYNLMVLLNRFTRWFGVVAVNFQMPSRIFHVEPKLSRKVKLGYSSLILWAVASFWIIIKYKQLGTLDRFNLTFAYWLPGIIVTVLSAVLIFMPQNICIMMNGFFGLIFHIQEKYYPSLKPDESKQSLVAEIVLLLLGATMAISNILVILILLYNPRDLVFLGDLIPLQYFSIPVRLAVILFHVYITAYFHLTLLVIVGTTILYGIYFTPILIREMRIGRNNYKMENSLRNPENVRHVYRCFQVTQANGLCVMGNILMICNAGLMLTSLYCNFVLIKYWEHLRPMSKAQLIVWTVTIIGIWSFTLELGRFLFTRGNKVLTSWKGDKWGSPEENKIMKKFHHSCKPILLCYDKKFVIGRVSVLVFFRGVTRGTFRALLMSK